MMRSDHSHQDLARSGRILANFGEFLPAKSREIDERTTKSICLVPQSTSSNKTFIFYSQVCDFFILISHKLKTQKRKEKYLDYTVTQIYRIQEKTNLMPSCFPGCALERAAKIVLEMMHISSGPSSLDCDLKG